MLRRAIALSAIFTASAVSAVPPAPLAPGVVDRDAAIITVPPPSELDGYVKHFADNLEIFENEKRLELVLLTGEHI